MAAVYYTVKKGDTLSHIAQRHNCTWQFLAKINNLSNPHLIYVGQKILIGGASSTPSTPSTSSKPSNSTPTNPTVATITAFGLQSDTDRTVFATWSWSRSNTDKYQVYWSYMTENGVWFTGSDTSTTTKDSIYNAPANATKVRFKVKPISKTYKSNDKDVNYWTASWSSEKKYSFSDNPPEEPPAPTVTIDNYTLTAQLDNLEINATEIEYQVVRNDVDIFITGKAGISTGTSKYSCSINPGDTYKVRCRAVRNGSYSDWSDYSESANTVPAKPAMITSISATSSTSVRLTWMIATAAKTYDIQYATKKEYLDGSNAVTTLNSIETAQYEVTGLTMGSEYFFRVRAVNDKGTSDWTEPVSVRVGTKPVAPTTWSSTTTAMIGEEVILFWVHNSEDGSSQTYAEVETTIDGVVKTYTVRNENSEEEKDRTLSYILNTSTFRDGVEVHWRARTAGVTLEYGEWSIERVINVYAPVTLQTNITDIHDNNIDTIESFPFYIKCIAGPDSQTPIGYHISLQSTSTYETLDEVGNVKVISEGEEVFSKHYNMNQHTLLMEMTPDLVDLVNNIKYKLVCTVSMNTGLNKSTEQTLTVDWDEIIFTPNAAITFNEENVTTNINPYCDYHPIKYYVVEKNGSGEYIRTSTTITPLDGVSVDNVLTTTEDIVYMGQNNVLFSIVESEDVELVEGVTLSVYRREYDGTFTELGKSLENGTTFITDPHPALDYARYRIVAISNETGAAGYIDLPGYPIQEKSVVIQWDETWTSYEEINADSFETSIWNGSILKLPYNIDVSDSNSPDITLVEYIGRNHPISYYGTQRGNTATWNLDIAKSDVNTLYALRRLANWMGDVYVREPSGSGYWANIAVSFSQKHCDVVIPVTLQITRVIGGV